MSPLSPSPKRKLVSKKSLEVLAREAFDADQFTEAVPLYKDALEQEPTSSSIRNNLAVSMTMVGDLQGAEELLRAILQSEPENDKALLNLGATLQDMGKEEDALLCYSQLLTRNPGSATAYKNLGKLQGHRQFYADAIDNYQKALLLEPHYSQAHFEIACLLSQCGRFDDAILEFQVFLQTNPRHYDALRGISLCYTLKYWKTRNGKALFLAFITLLKTISISPWRAENLFIFCGIVSSIVFPKAQQPN